MSLHKSKLNIFAKFARPISPLAIVLMLGLLLLTACGSDSTSLSLPATTTASNTTAATTSVATTAATSAAATSAAATSAATTAATTNAVAPTSAATVPTTTPALSPIPVPTVSVPAAVQQEMDKIAKQTEKTRALNFKQPVERNFMTRADLAKYQEEQFRRENPPQEVAKYEKFLKIFGYVPNDFDFTRNYLDLLNSQVLGFYDPQTKKLYIVVDGDPNKLNPLVKFTAEHELTHGLQDQTFDLTKLRPQRKPGATEWNDDFDNAILALVEGDAVQSQYAWIQGGNLPAAEVNELVKLSSSFDQKVLDNSPLYLRETLQFPYADGLNFVQKIFAKGGWEAVNKVFREYPPRSTSQIMHPEKYDKRVEPVNVAFSSLTDTLGNGWKSLDINTLGELQVKLWLQLGSDETTSKNGANGWAGDRYQVLENGQGAVGYVWRSQWDSENEAVEFFNTAIPTLKKNHALSGEGGVDTKRTWNSATHNITLLRKGNEVLVMVLPKDGAGDKVTAKLGF